jgi:hypothetical protein
MSASTSPPSVPGKEEGSCQKLKREREKKKKKRFPSNKLLVNLTMFETMNKVVPIPFILSSIRFFFHRRVLSLCI